MDGLVAVVANSTEYSITVNGTKVAITSDSNATAIEIVAALETAFLNLEMDGVNFTNNANGTFEVYVVEPGAGWSIKASSNIELTNQASPESWSDALLAVEMENNEWIALTTETHIDENIIELAGEIEAREKIYVVAVSDADVKTTSTNDVASQLKSLGYQKTAIMWKADADTAYPECAWVAGQIQPAPGNNSWAYKSLTGTATDRLTGTESVNLSNKNVSTYEYISGVNSVVGGKMAGGEFIDVMLGVLWLTARMRERIWFRLANTPKIAYTNAGIAILEAEVRAQLQEGIRNNFLAANPTPVVVVPDALSVDPNLRALRTLEDLKFEARLAGAIHFVKISGSVFV